MQLSKLAQMAVVEPPAGHQAPAVSPSAEPRLYGHAGHFVRCNVLKDVCHCLSKPWVACEGCPLVLHHHSDKGKGLLFFLVHEGIHLANNPMDFRISNSHQ